MKLAECKLVSVTPYSQSRYYKMEKWNKETSPDYEARTWRERCHYNKNGNIIIPPMQFANAIKAAAKYLSLPIPGEARKTFTKHFEAGILVQDPVILPVKKDEVEGEWLFVPSDGRRGGGTRVEKCFPFIPEWKGVVLFYVLDDIITKEAFTQVLATAGSLIGIGRFRPINCGYYGRFSLEENGLTWADQNNN